jgi:hypothetical protein
VFENIQLSGISWFKRQRKGKEYTMMRRFVGLLFTKPGLEKQNGVNPILYFRQYILLRSICDLLLFNSWYKYNGAVFFVTTIYICRGLKF